MYTSKLFESYSRELAESSGDQYEVWQKYYEDGNTTTEFVQSFDTFEKAQKFADGLNQDPDCEAWVKDLNESENLTEERYYYGEIEHVKNELDSIKDSLLQLQSQLAKVTSKSSENEYSNKQLEALKNIDINIQNMIANASDIDQRLTETFPNRIVSMPQEVRDYINTHKDDLNESTNYNTKSKEEFEDLESFRSAIHDDINTITNTLENLKSKVNTDEAVEALETGRAMFNSSLLDKAYK